MERRFCEDTPDFQFEATDFGGIVQFLNPDILAISNCPGGDCDPAFGDYVVITGDLRSQGLGALLADAVCEAIEKQTEETGDCDTSGEGGDKEREKICP